MIFWAPVVLVLLTAHAVVRTASSYLLHNIAADRSIALLIFVPSLILGAFVTFRFAKLTHAILLYALQSILCALFEILCFWLFGDSSWFAPFLYLSAVLLGLSTGATFSSTIVIYRTIQEKSERILNLLRIEVILPILVAIPFLLHLSQKAGPLRTCVVLSAAATATLPALAAAALKKHPKSTRIQAYAVLITLAQVLVLPVVQSWVPTWEIALAPDPVIHSSHARGGRVTVTSGRGAFQLFIDGAMRVSTIDGYRYRESLVHPVINSNETFSKVLVVGGGDGQAVREILRYPTVQSITVIENNRALNQLARTQPILLHENRGSMLNNKVQVIEQDALVWARDTDELFDTIIVDLGEPANAAKTKLYTIYFFEQLAKHMTKNAVSVVSTLSPHANRRAFWSLVHTLRAAGFQTMPYHADLPTYGELGFIMFSHSMIAPPQSVPEGLAYLDNHVLEAMLSLTADESEIDAEPSRLHHQVFVKYRDE